jgi:hypothetical protein
MTYINYLPLRINSVSETKLLADDTSVTILSRNIDDYFFSVKFNSWFVTGVGAGEELNVSCNIS